MADNKPKSEMKRVEVQIFGEIYRLRTEDPDALAKLVEMVDSTMRTIAQSTRSFSGGRIAVLAALKIAEDYVQLKQHYDELMEYVDENK
ncbi:MAG: cell division protein ZapA [Selenomonadaceae bacterium]|nr:cell division protein ZapA [Selenomonadaceae bacterium]